jgi:hypothetical protein
MIVCDGWKFIFNPGGIDELYDLDSDPAELRNLCGLEESESMKQKLAEILCRDMEKNSAPMVQYAAELMG